MAWDSSRQVPWRKLTIYLVLYAVIVFVVFVAQNRTNSVASSLPGLAIGVIFAGTLMVVLTKFGWKLPFLRSKQEIAEARQARIDARSIRTGGSRSGSRSRGRSTSTSQSLIDGPRPKPAPTSRTSTGPSQHPRHTTKTRKH